MNAKWDFSDFKKFSERLSNLSAFDQLCQLIAKAVAGALHEALFRNTPVLTGNLCAAWGGKENYAYVVEKFGYGYRVTLENHGANYKNFKYGLAVNDGHKTPGGGGWVMGRFFVEKSIVQTANSAQLEALIMKQIQKWWNSV